MPSEELQSKYNTNNLWSIKIQENGTIKLLLYLTYGFQEPHKQVDFDSLVTIVGMLLKTIELSRLFESCISFSYQYFKYILYTQFIIILHFSSYWYIHAGDNIFEWLIIFIGIIQNAWKSQLPWLLKSEILQLFHITKVIHFMRQNFAEGKMLYKKHVSFNG